jgi:phage repressor protein C with HTH and peptisase S24 domain
LSTTIEDLDARLELLMRQFGSVAELARAIGVSDNAIYKWLAGRGQPSLASVVAIARVAGVSVEWLATGREAVAHTGGAVGTAAAGDYAFMPRGEIGVGGRRATRLRSELIVDVLAFGAGWLEHRLAADPGRLMLLEVSGDSMAPTLREGDLALADLRETRARIDGVYVLREQNDLVIKRLQRRRFGAALTIRSDNPAYEPIGVSPDVVNVVGRVIWVGKTV